MPPEANPIHLPPDPAGANRDMIAFQGVSKSFDEGRDFAVRDVSFSVAPRAFVALVGDSGSGKTTLLKMINRLIEPDQGTVSVDGESVQGMAGYSLRRRIGYVFQGIGLFPHMSVAENIGITPLLLDWQQSEIDTRTAELIDLVELPQLPGSYAF
jgi:osmoprotectant transport system ATP-binding protein